MIVYEWKDVKNLYETPNEFSVGTGISVGSFDGLHLGHRTLIDTLVKNSNANNFLPGIITFSRPLPFYKHPTNYPGDISTLSQRLKLFEALGIKFVVVVDFNQNFASLSGIDFLDFIKRIFNMQFICEGIDFKCGYKGATDIQSISYWAQKNNVETAFVPPVLYKLGTEEEERISSSYIRQMILKGFLTTVQELLNRPYELDLQNSNITISDTNLIINKKDLEQIVPLNGFYHPILEANNFKANCRLEIQDSNLLIHTENLSFSDKTLKSLIFE